MLPAGETAGFAARHIGLGRDDVAVMLERLGFGSLGDLVDAALPEEIRIDEPIVLDGIDRPLTETEATAAMTWLANANTPMRSLIGLGYSGTLTPAVIRRGVLEDPSWYTAYTPYQPEISQGRLEALLNYQTMVCDLVGMEIANSSLLCEGTAAAEAMAMAPPHHPQRAGLLLHRRRLPSAGDRRGGHPGRPARHRRRGWATPKPTWRPPRCTARCWPLPAAAALSAIWGQ